MSNNKIIFLDIDGVLCIDWNQGHADGYGHGFDEGCVANFATIIQRTGAAIVISSTWRKAGIEVMKQMWRERKLPGHIAGMTPVLHTKRGDEVRAYLSENPCHSYVILDDDDDFLEEQSPFVVRTSVDDDGVYNGLGLTADHTERAVDILNTSTMLSVN